MNISSIKERADELLVNCKPKLIRIFLIMMAINLAKSFVSGGYGLLSTFISLAITILFMPFMHGYVVSCLKVVRNNSSSLQDDDAFVGFTRFKDLFFTYFCMFIIEFFVIFILLLIIMLVLMLFLPTIPNLSMSINFMTSQMYGIDLSQFSTLVSLVDFTPQLVFLFLFCMLSIVVVSYIVTIFLFATPYLLEQYHLVGMAAVKESFSFMKGHGWEYFKLSISFMGWIILAAVLGSVVSSVFAFLPILGSILGTLATGVFAVYTYLTRYQVSLAIFFEEIAYYRYDSNNNQGIDTGEDI